MARYRNAPLKYVVFVAELSTVSVLAERAALDQIHAALRDFVPVREDLTDAVGARPDGTLGPQGGGARLVDAEQHRAVAVVPSRIAVDTTQYSTFSEFGAFLDQVLEAVAEVAPGRACRRLGLRYIDEIRVPHAEPGNIVQWRDWIDDALFAPIASKPEPAYPQRQGQRRREIAGVVDEAWDDGYGVRFAWHTGTGHVVAPVGPLVVPNPSEPGPYFALDTDSYWTARPGAEVLGLGDPALLERVRMLHEPVQAFFEMSLTQRLRDDVLQPMES